MHESLHSFLAELIPVLGAVLTAVLSYVAFLFSKKLKLQLSEQEQQMIRSSVRSAINGAEEWAARKLHIEEVSVEGYEKASWVHQRLRELYPNLSLDELDFLIDEELTTIPYAGLTDNYGVDDED